MTSHRIWWKLHSHAYSTVTYANPEAEKIGQTVLANQFISGLRPELQAKVVGMEGSVDALVLQARFEETKAKELAAIRTPLPQKSAVMTEPTPSKPQNEPCTSTPPTPPTTSSTASTNQN